MKLESTSLFNDKNLFILNTYPTKFRQNLYPDVKYFGESNVCPMTGIGKFITSYTICTQEKCTSKNFSGLSLEEQNILIKKLSSVNEDNLTHYMCIESYFVEQAAIRTDKSLEVIDFPLPDGTPFLRTYRVIN